LRGGFIEPEPITQHAAAVPSEAPQRRFRRAELERLAIERLRLVVVVARFGHLGEREVMLQGIRPQPRPRSMMRELLKHVVRATLARLRLEMAVRRAMP